MGKFDVYTRNAEKRKVLQAFLDSKLLTMKHGNVLNMGVWVGEYDIDYYEKVTINNVTFKYDFNSDTFK